MNLRTEEALEIPFDYSAPPKEDPEFLILDIGGNVGALVVYTDEDYLGAEIDLTPSGMPRSHQVHTMVRRRRAVTRELIAGVFPEVAAGLYTIRGLNGEALGEVIIAGGRVTEHHVGNGSRAA